MSQTAIIYHGSWPSLSGVIADEPAGYVRSLKRKAARDKNWRKGITSMADERGKYHNPSLTFTMDVEVTSLSGSNAAMITLGVGKTFTAGLANFAAIWREHDPSAGVIILEDADDAAEAEGEVPLTSSLTFVHKPFVNS